MSRPRKKVFGPLTYSTLVLAALATGYTAVVSNLPRLERWSEMRWLTTDLRHEDSKVRAGVVGTIVQRRPDLALPYLLEALHDPSEQVRAAACQSLVKVGADPSVVVPALVSTMGDKRDSVRLEAARALGMLPNAASFLAAVSPDAPGRLTPGQREGCLEALGRLMKDPSGAVRTAAADSLGMFGPDRTIATRLAAAANDEDRATRLAAAKALLKVNGPGDRTAARILVAMVADPEAVPDRMMTVEVLKATSNPVQDQAVAAMAGLLARGDPAVLPDVIDCLAAIGKPARAALPALEVLWKVEDSGLRSHAGNAIVSIGGQETPRALEILLALISDPALPIDQRITAIECARGANPNAPGKAAPSLIRQLGDSDADVRRNAIQLLGFLIEDGPVKVHYLGIGY